MGIRSSWQLVRQAASQWSEDRASEMGAAVAYFTIFSIAPLLVIAIAIAGLVFGEDAARGNVETQLQQTIGKEAAHLVQELLKNANQPHVGIWATVAGGVVLVAGALGAFLELRSALCRIWHLNTSCASSFLGIILDYVIAFIMVLCCAVLLLVSVAISTALTYLNEEVFTDMPGSQALWQTVEFLVSFTLVTLIFAVMFRVLSARRIPWRLIWYGAGITSLLFTIGKTLIGFYLGYTGTASTYGAAGSLVVLLIWIYYSSQILFFGSELIQARRTYEASHSASQA
jgi:membrane protein